MKRTIIAAGIVSVGLLVFAGRANADGVKEGQWSMTTVIRMEGADDQSAEAMAEMEKMSPEEKAMMEQMMGGMKFGAPGGGMGMSTTTTQCITNDNPVPESEDQEDCQKTHSMTGNTVHFEVVCDDSRSTGDVTYENESMHGTIQSTQTADGTEENVTIDISGQYVGPCDQNASNAVPSLNTQGLAERELAIKQKELDLKEQELQIKQQELDLQTASAADQGNNASSGPSTLDNVNSAVNTTNNVKSTFGGLRSLLGR